MQQEPHYVASWADTGKVHLWDVRSLLAGVEDPAVAARNAMASGAGKRGKSKKKGKRAAGAAAGAAPIFTFTGHPTEGFALDWSNTTPGRLATGDCKRNIYVWDATSGKGSAAWNVDKVPYTAHFDSVEDIQWSPTEDTVFASCSSDKTVRVWDTRNKAGSMLSVEAHTADVNVIHWNRKVRWRHTYTYCMDEA